MPQIQALPERKFIFADTFSYRTLLYEHELYDKNNKKISKKLVEIYCQAQNKIIMLSLFNHKKDKNNLQILEQFAQEFGRKVLRNLKSRISGSSRVSKGRINHRNR